MNSNLLKQWDETLWILVTERPLYKLFPQSEG